MLPHLEDTAPELTLTLRAGDDDEEEEEEAFSATDYDVRVESRSIGAGVRITSDRPVANMSLWSIRSNISLEPDVDINVDPGGSMSWTFVYTYYTIPK